MYRAVLFLQLCPTLCDPIDYSPPGSSVHRILQAAILEWVAVPSSRTGIIYLLLFKKSFFLGVRLTKFSVVTSCFSNRLFFTRDKTSRGYVGVAATCP